MAGFLLGTGILEYNGITFPVQIGSHVSITPLYDTSNRSIHALQYNFSIVTVFHDNMGLGSEVPGTVDQHIEFIIRNLSQPGQLLKFDDKGLGTDFTIDTLKADPLWGPKPRVVAWEPLGNNKAVQLTWECEVHVFPCYVSPNTFKTRPTSITYSMSWGIDEMGLTQRSITATIKSISRRSTDAGALPGAVELSADLYRNNFAATIPEGYTRTSQNYTLNEDRTQLQISLLDTEIPSDNPYYFGIIQPDVSVGVSSINRVLATWNFNIDGQITVAQGVPRWYAWIAFNMIIRQRQKLAKDNAKLGTITNPQDPERTGSVLFVVSQSITEHIYQRSMSFRVGMMLRCKLSALLKAAGFWQPIAFADPDALVPIYDPNDPDTWTMIPLEWKDYNDYMIRYVPDPNPDPDPEDPPTAAEHGPWLNRGVAELFFNTDSDYIINICDNNRVNINVVDASHKNLIPPQTTDQTLAAGTPDPRNTWISFFSEATLIQHPNTVQHTPLVKPEGNANTGQFNYAATTSQVRGNQLSAAPLTQNRTQSQYFVRFTGMAMRSHYPISPIYMLTYGGQAAELVGTYTFTNKEISNYGGIPIYMAKWSATYILANTPISDITRTQPDMTSALSPDA